MFHVYHYLIYLFSSNCIYSKSVCESHNEMFNFQNNPAENLLKAEGAYKWKCASAGEKNPSVVLQVRVYLP